MAPASILSGSNWLVYAGIVVCSLANALFGLRFATADTVAYLDISDAIRDHRWHSVVNAYWFPLYPALLAVGKACFGNRPQYELMAARLAGAFTWLLFVLASVAVAAAARRLMRARGANADELLPPRILYMWVAILAYFFCSQDMRWYTPDALVSALMLLTVAALLLAIAEGRLLAYVAVGLFGGLAFWTKSFAFPFFFLWMLLAASANIRRFAILRRLVLSFIVFALIAGPYVWQISAAKGRFTFGESGRLDMAWYVNGADQFDPVANASVYLHGTAHASLKHPGELLSTTPKAVYFSRQQIHGSLPAWDDPSYWGDGLTPRFVSGQVEASVKRNLLAAQTILLRLQPLLLFGVLCYWGYTVRRPSLTDPILTMTLVLALACIGAYSLILLEGRFVDFALVLIGAVYGACSLAKHPAGSLRSLHAAILLIAVLVLFSGFRLSWLQWSETRQQVGARPMQGIYSMPIVSSGADMAARYPRGTEVACMGFLACYGDPYWAKFAGVSITASIEPGQEDAQTGAAEGCEKLEQHPQVLDLLRKRGVQAIVARFNEMRPCSAAWQPLGKSGGFFYLPLSTGAASE
jgi:hypothetical protein